MKKHLLIASTVLLFACQSKTKPQNTDADTTQKPSEKEITSAKTELANINLKDKILGIWTNGSSENATFRIDRDSIFYVEQLENYRYTLHGDSIQITYPDYSYTAKLSFIKDTLVMSSPEDGPSKYWKFKD